MNMIKQHRRNKGMTQDKLASRLKVTQGTVSGWERGEFLPSASMTPKVARVLGIPREKLVLAIEYDIDVRDTAAGAVSV